MRKLTRTGAFKPAPLLARNIGVQQSEMNAYFRIDLEERQKRRPPLDTKIINAPEVVGRILGNQGNCCAYCEVPLDGESLVTHYRPTSNAVTSDGGRSDIQYYAWFAYEWKNLMILCIDCQLAKGQSFPLVGSPISPGSPWSDAVQRERPLLLDPYVALPSNHLMFTRQGEAVARSQEGEVTIQLLELNRLKLKQARARTLELLQDTILKSKYDGLAFELARFMKSCDFRGVVEIFLQNLLRVTDEQPRGTERMQGEKLLTRLEKVFALMDDSQALNLLGRADNRDLRFLVFRTDLGGFKSPRRARNAYLSALRIDGFRFIREMSLSVDSLEGRTPCLMLLGENASGKTSILQAIKISLSSKQERAWIQKHRKRLKAGSGKENFEVELKNGVKRRVVANGEGMLIASGDVECQVLAYGARRYFTPRSPREPKKYFNATLFNAQATLRDPRDWLEEQDSHTFNSVARALRLVLDLGEDDSIVKTAQRGIMIRVHGALVPIEHLSDGYRSLFAMAIDIMRELLEGWDNLEVAEAIVLIDEIEVHLHPRWKMRVMTALRDAMPKVQFICTTHDPLCLRGMKSGEVRLIERKAGGEMQVHSDLPDVSKLRIEQILSSDHFGLSSTDDPEQDYIVRRLAEIAGLTEERMTMSLRQERDALLTKYEGVPYVGSSQDRQILAEALTRHLRMSQVSSVEERSSARAESIDAVIAVLQRAMNQ